MGEDGEQSKDVGSFLLNLAPSCKESELGIWEVGEWVGSTKGTVARREELGL